MKPRKKGKPVPPIVHILMAGRALCKPGTPEEWTHREVWVSMAQHAQVTCSLCREIYARLKGAG
jgi:uncharacterized Zn-finger protein